MKRLVVCIDGTWNDPAQEENGIPCPTNVYKFYNAVTCGVVNDVEQRKYYHTGVGSGGSVLNKAAGGLVGAGIGNQICSAYHWLAQNYEEGDHLFLAGFSRGAFAVRCLAAFVGQGLLNLQGLSSKECWERVHTAYLRGYRAKRLDWAKPDWPFFSDNRVNVRFLGVWDTVGAFGVPDDIEVLNFFENKKKWEFSDKKLGAHVVTARHAMAIDEVRSSFTVTRWSNAGTHGDVQELWFPGAHADVGGGYANCDLSHGALHWMLEEAAKVGLVFRPNILPTIPANPLGAMHNSYKGFFAAVLRSRPRNVAALVPANHHSFHVSAMIRQAISPLNHRPYLQTTVLSPGQSHSVDVYADTQWNFGALYLETGAQYTFHAAGEWMDSRDACNWKGTERDKATVGDMLRGVGSQLGRLETWVKNKLRHGSSLDLFWTKRVEEVPWFALTGAIANDSGDKEAVKSDGSPCPHQYVNLSKHESRPLDVKVPGYLYCFANDAWSMYHNNRGSLRLTVTRVK